MIKKKLHTLQFIQNKEEIHRLKTMMGMLEDIESQQETLRRVREEMDKLSIKHKKYMRKLKLQFWLLLLASISSVVITFYLFGIFKN